MSKCPNYAEGPRGGAVSAAAATGGFVLPAVIVFLVLLSLMVAAALLTATDESRSARAARESGDALYAAEAGLHRAVANCDTTVLFALDPGEVLDLGGGTLDDGASYRAAARRVDNDDAQEVYLFTVEGRGAGPLGGRQVVRLAITPTSIFPPVALAVEGDLEIPGGPTVVGGCGGAHTNGSIDISGGVVTTGDELTATGSAIVTGSVTDPDGDPVPVIPNADSLDIPDLNPLDYCGTADFILRDGWLVEVALSDSTSLSGGNQHYGWGWNPSNDTYTLEDDASNQPGTVCAHGDVVLDGNPGSPSTPYQFSLFATGSVDVDGNPFLVADHPDNVLIVAGGDMHLNGNFVTGAMNFDGLVYGRSHCHLTGNFQAAGHILCFGAPDPIDAEDLLDIHLVDGNPTLRFECGTSMLDQQIRPLVHRAWTQLGR